LISGPARASSDFPFFCFWFLPLQFLSLIFFFSSRTPFISFSLNLSCSAPSLFHSSSSFFLFYFSSSFMLSFLSGLIFPSQQEREVTWVVHGLEMMAGGDGGD
jgi:hypothetical protein